MNKETIYSAKNQKSNQGRIMPGSPHGACVSRIQFTASHNDIIIVIAIIRYDTIRDAILTCARKPT